MALTATGLIVREHNIGEADRFVTVLTDSFGVIRASVRGARRVNSRAGVSTKLLSYSRFSLVKGRDKYIVDTASPIRVFLASGGGIEDLSLAQYFCELFAAVAPSDEEAAPFLQLILNSLHLLEKGEHRDRIKAVAECRLMALAGYLPDVHQCRCGVMQAPLYFQPLNGVLCCEHCRIQGCVPLSQTVLDTLRFVLEAEASRCFSFRISDEQCLAFADIAEQFVLNQLSRRFQTLDFYHSLSSLGVYDL